VGRPGGSDDIHPPELRITELVRDGHLHRGDVVHAQVKMRHPNRTGLTFHDGRFSRESAPFHIKELDVIYAGERVSRFELTSALSDDPFITFALRVDSEGPLKVLVSNNRGKRFEAAHEIRFS
jgi:sulfur-oxidizing protein SoxY